jgi:2-oxoglutarate dehydrogenase E1 component
MDKFSYLSNADPSVIDELYSRYRTNPESVDEGWRRFFEGFEFQKADFSESSEEVPSSNMHREFKVLALIHGYRTRGHLFTKTNPVRERRKYSPTLEITNFGLTDSDLDVVFQAGEEIGIGPATLREIIAHLQQTYCESIGIEYMYIRDPERVAWLRNKIELKNRPKFDAKTKRHIFSKLNEAAAFEQYLQKKFVGQKRFSLEGCEVLMPALDTIVTYGADLGVKEFVMGMAHRGRLNALAHVFKKPYEEIFAEFEGREYDDDGIFDGDVKYHLGYSCDTTSSEGDPVHLTLSPNPSHLEAVNPVVLGIARAKIDNYLKEESAIVPILIHGDAAIAGQGIVYEVVQMALLDGYRAGGTLHIVVNNQVGFTTNYLDGRSSTYCTDVAKTTLCPVFHVNADDVEAVLQTVRIALEYRQTFHMDVFIDLLGYRKYGHNEGDEPKFTQPNLYKLIASHPNVRDIYLNKLIVEGLISSEEAASMLHDFEALLNSKYDLSKGISKAYVKHFLEETWKGIRLSSGLDFDRSPETGYDRERLVQLARSINTLKPGPRYFRKIEKLFEDRVKMIENDQLDWSMGELLAYATLLDQGHPIRISGQDVERGTFSHRHAVITTEDKEEEVVPLSEIQPGQGKFSIYNSLLSEYGVLGFDYGYAFATPNGLTIWEAQFGDFNNGAQIIIDQFLSAAEDKWRTMNGICLFLPHGYEGMGSEHSSARLERYLQLCAEYNMQVCNVTTPANFFHLLRRQLAWPFRKPLVVMTPKKLLRYPKAVSSINDMANGRFLEVLDDPQAFKKEVDTLVLCSGKVYYDALEEKERVGNADNMAFIRLEQLYPLPVKAIESIMATYPKANRFIWLQEEPENMGAWSYVLRVLRKIDLIPICLPETASPATGSPKVHELRFNNLMKRLFSFAKVNA